MFLISNTDLCMDVKTLLRTDRLTRVGKNYRGVLMRDGLDHYTFLESLRPAARRNPHVYVGKYITVTRHNDGTYHPNFRPVRMTEGFNLERYAQGVYNELCIALGGLVEE